MLSLKLTLFKLALLSIIVNRLLAMRKLQKTGRWFIGVNFGVGYVPVFKVQNRGKMTVTLDTLKRRWKWIFQNIASRIFSDESQRG